MLQSASLLIPMSYDVLQVLARKTTQLLKIFQHMTVAFSTKPAIAYQFVIQNLELGMLHGLVMRLRDALPKAQSTILAEQCLKLIGYHQTGAID